MRDLNFDLKRLQAAHDDGSHGTRTARSYALAQAADNSDRVEAAYRRSDLFDRRRLLMNDWAAYVA